MDSNLEMGEGYLERKEVGVAVKMGRSRKEEKVMVVLAENVEWVGECGRVQSKDGAASE